MLALRPTCVEHVRKPRHWACGGPAGGFPSRSAARAEAGLEKAQREADKGPFAARTFSHEAAIYACLSGHLRLLSQSALCLGWENAMWAHFKAAADLRQDLDLRDRAREECSLGAYRQGVQGTGRRPLGVRRVDADKGDAAAAQCLPFCIGKYARAHCARCKCRRCKCTQPSWRLGSRIRTAVGDRCLFTQKRP